MIAARKIAAGQTSIIEAFRILEARRACAAGIFWQVSRS